MTLESNVVQDTVSTCIGEILNWDLHFMAEGVDEIHVIIADNCTFRVDVDTGKQNRQKVPVVELAWGSANVDVITQQSTGIVFIYSRW